MRAIQECLKPFPSWNIYFICLSRTTTKRCMYVRQRTVELNKKLGCADKRGIAVIWRVREGFLALDYEQRCRARWGQPEPEAQEFRVRTNGEETRRGGSPDTSRRALSTTDSGPLDYRQRSPLEPPETSAQRRQGLSSVVLRGRGPEGPREGL